MRVAIVGLGHIGAGAGGGDEHVVVPRSHVGAALATAEVEIVALADTSEERREAVRRRWPALSASILRPGLAELAPGTVDLVVIATSPEGRRPILHEVLRLRPRLLLIEKPLAVDCGSAERVVADCSNAGIALRVHFNRRFDRGHIALREMFAERPCSVVARYGRGLRNYGSHLIDLLLDWCGPIREVAALDVEEAGTAPDPSIGFRCRFVDGGAATAVALTDTHYDNFDIDFFYRDGRIELANGGVERRVWRTIRDRHYKGYGHLALDEVASAESPVGGFTEFYAAAREHLVRGRPLAGCDGRSALAGMAVIDAIRRSAAEGGAWQRLNPAGGLL